MDTKFQSHQENGQSNAWRRRCSRAVDADLTVRKRRCVIIHASRLCITGRLHSRSGARRNSRTDLQLKSDDHRARHPEPDPIRTCNGALSQGAIARATLDRRCQDCNGTLAQRDFDECPHIDCQTVSFPKLGAALATGQNDFAATFLAKKQRSLAPPASFTCQVIRSRSAFRAKKKKLCRANFPCKLKLEWSRLRKMPIISVATIGTEQR